MPQTQKNSLSLLAGIFSGAVLLYAAIALLFAPALSQAALVPVCATTGNCGICDIVNVFITLGRWLIVGAGGLVVLIIVNASFGLVTSAGNSEKIGAAKKQIVGGILGMLITMAAFQLVTILIMMLATPSGLQSYEALNQTGESAALRAGSLTNFLGVAWWTICSADDLKNQNGVAVFPSTANCAYWGDGTSCSETGNKICCAGTCISGECTQTSGLPSYGTPSVTPPQTISADEASVRSQLQDGGIDINKDPCPDINTSTDCTSVAGLSQETINKLIAANNTCGVMCIYITGGTERGGHSAGTSHGSPNVVDIRNTAAARQALESIGLTATTTFRVPNTYVCDTAGQAVSCATASHLHVTF